MGSLFVKVTKFHILSSNPGFLIHFGFVQVNIAPSYHFHHVDCWRASIIYSFETIIKIGSKSEVIPVAADANRTMTMIA